MTRVTVASFHHHEVVSFPGANEVEEKEVETTTRRIAG